MSVVFILTGVGCLSSGPWMRVSCPVYRCRQPLPSEAQVSPARASGTGLSVVCAQPLTFSHVQPERELPGLCSGENKRDRNASAKGSQAAQTSLSDSKEVSTKFVMINI